MRARSPLLILLVIVCSSGCGSNNTSFEEATGEGSIQALHAISDLGPVNFLIEETTLANIDYKESSGITDYDDLTYNFNFDILLPGEAEFTRLISTSVSVVAETEYTFILTGSLQAPEIIQWEQFRRDWATLVAAATADDTTVTILDAAFGHLANEIGAVDIYLGSPGTVPVLGNQVATMSYGELQPSLEIESGTYQLVVTPAGDPDEYLFASDAFGLSSALSVSFIVMDSDASKTSDFVVRLLGTGTSTELVEIDAESTISVIHAADNSGPLDVIVGDQFANPLAPAISFAEKSAQTVVQSGLLNLNITPAGNPGSFLAEESITVLKGARYSLFLTGLPGQLIGFLLRDSARPISTHALLRVYQGSARIPSIDFYIVPPDSDISLLGASLPSIVYTGATGYQSIAPGDYDLVFTLPGTKTIVAGPTRVSLNSLAIYDIVTTDTVQTDIAGLLFFADE